LQENLLDPAITGWLMANKTFHPQDTSSQDFPNASPHYDI